MTRFVFIADTHYGATETGYQQQKRYPYNIGEIVKALDNWIKKDNSIDFVLHAGDMVDCASKENIKEASDIFDLSVPVYLCLGNHDLTEKNALELWFTYAPSFFPEGKSEFLISNKDVAIYAVPNQWCEHPYYWEKKSSPHFLKEQIDLFTSYKNETLHSNIHILCTHSTVMGVPSGQTGFESDFHAPSREFYNEAIHLTKLDPKIKCILSGHSHINTNVMNEEVHFITASSLIEVPFEFKLIEVDASMLKIKTISLASDLSFKYNYDYNRTYVQGREQDRFVERLFK